MTNPFDLGGRVAIVTGATKGIGLGIATRFAAHNARVVVSSRKQAECESVAGGLNAQFDRDIALGVASDLEDVASLERLVSATVSHWGAIDTLILNAAKNDLRGGEADASPEQFAAMLTANVRNNFLVANAALPHLKARRGNVVFMSSIAGTGASPIAAVYGICKRALFQLVENLAVEWSPYGIRVNAIAPGITVSEATRPLWEDARARAAVSATIPLQRLGEPDDIANCALYLASLAASYVTGQSIVVDGGLTLRGAGQSRQDVLTEVLGAHD